MTSSTTWRRRIGMMSSQTIGIPKSSIPTAAIMSAVAVAAAYVVTTPSSSSAVSSSTTSSTTTFCDASVNTTKQEQEIKHDHPHPQHSPYQFGSIKKENDTKSVSTSTNNEFYYGYFPKRQLFQPKLAYPLWDSNWDGREIVSGNQDDVEHRKMMRTIRKNGVTRHILLVRHGQYNETSRHDVERTLTPLGIQQAHLTGQRLASLMKQYSTNTSKDGHETILPCNIVSIRVSQLQRAKETADIIASYLPASVTYFKEGDASLNEGRPCHTIPSGGPVPAKLIEVTDMQHQRIEHAYQEYFYRKNYIMDTTSTSSSSDNQPNVLLLRSSSEETTSNTADTNHSGTSAITTTTANNTVTTKTMIGDEKHEFEIIVCHANVIRYFLCRALQLPPEVWLRYCPFNCSLTYLTIRPTGTVSCRMLGDIGHLPYDACTFSQHHGFNW